MSPLDPSQDPDGTLEGDDPTAADAPIPGSVPAAAEPAAEDASEPFVAGQDETWGEELDAWGATLGEDSEGALRSADPGAADGSFFLSEPDPEAPPALPLRDLDDASPEAWHDPAAWLGWTAGPPVISATPAGPPDAALVDLVADERLFASDATEEPAARALALALTAARLAERAGDRLNARRFLDEALAVAPTSAGALRARLLGAEWGAEREESSAEMGLPWLRRLGAVEGEDAPYYRALLGEWALALAAEGVAAETNGLALAAADFPPGLARLLGQVEVACLEGRPERAAEELTSASALPQGPLRVGLELLGARFLEAAGRPRMAAEVRARLRARVPAEAADVLGSLRDAARTEGIGAISLLRGVLSRLPRSPLAAAVARWLAFLQAHAADGDGARETLRAAVAEGVTSPALARDRFDLSVGGDVAGLEKLAHEAAAAWPSLVVWPVALLLAATARFDRRLVDPRLAPTPVELDEDARALLVWLERLTAQGPEDPALALVAERAAEAPGEVETRLQLFRAWASLDPARAAPAWAAASSLSREAHRPEDLTVALRPLVDEDPGHPGFWWLAEKDAAAGRYDEAAVRFEAAAEAWRGSALAPWLKERAAEWRSVRHPAAGLEVLEELARDAPERDAVGVRATWLRVLRAAPDLQVAGGLRTGAFAAAADADEQASIWGRVAAATGSLDAIEAAFGARPADPQNLALLMTSDRDVPDRLADELARAARDASGEGAVLLALLSGTWRLIAGEDDRVREETRALMERPGSHLAIDRFLRRAARSVADPHLRARLLYFAHRGQSEPAAIEDEAAAGALELAETLMTIDEAAAERLLRRLAYGHAGLEARLDFLRLKGSLADLGQLWSWDARRGFFGRLARLAEQVPGMGAREIARLVSDAPPFETQASLRTQAWALLALPHGESLDDVSALLVEADKERRFAFALRWRALARTTEPAERAALLMAFAEVFATGPSAAALWAEAGGLFERLERVSEAERAYTRAREAEPNSFPARTGLRRLAISAGDLDKAATLAADEDRLLTSARARVKVLLTSANVAAAAGRESISLDLLKRAFSLAPEDTDVFGRLADRLEDLGKHRELADLLGERLMVTRNPFEVTSLRLRRAELLSSVLGEETEARRELEGVLQKEPDHARALQDLAGLLERAGEFAGAADLLVRRAVKESDPERLGHLYLRLGAIYREHLKDARRALGAYLKVLRIDPSHQVSLAAASELHAQMSDARGAIPFVEKLLSLGLAPEAERQWRLRLGQLQEQSQDLRQAALNLRRAWDQPPTNLVALRELARFLERSRDDRGRRLLWEEAQERLTADALDPGPAVSVGEAWLGLREVATQRQRSLAARFAGQMADGTAPFDGRGIVARLLRDPEAEDRLYRALAPAVSSGLRALLRAVAPHLAHERKLDLRARGLSRDERAGKGELREVIMASAHEAGLADLEIYVKADVRASLSFPGSPPALVLSRAIAHLGAPGLRFVAARESYLLASGNAFLLADEPAQAGLFLAGLVRVFVPSFVHPSFTEELIEQRAEQLGRTLPKKKKTDLAPFGWEAAGPFDIQALREGLRAVADVVGLLGCGHLPSALASVVAERAQTPGANLGQVPDARALVAFALSADLDDLWRAWS